MKKSIVLFLLFYGLLQAAPSVVVSPYPGIQSINTTSPVIYFEVAFSEVVSGFDSSDLIVGGTSNATVGFINQQFLGSPNNQNFMVQVDVGALNDGTVTLFIPSGVAFGGGDPNSSSNVCTINYQFPLDSCTSYDGSQFISGQINYNFENNIPTATCTNYFYVGNFNIPLVNIKYIPVYNNTSSSVCVGLTVVTQGAVGYEFNVTKILNSASPFDMTNNFLGASYNSSYETLNAAGHAFKCNNFELSAGEIAYVEVFTSNTNFVLYLDGLSCSSLSIDEVSAIDNFEIFPNPTNGIFKIEGVDFDKIRVYNLMGQLVLETSSPTVTIENFAKGTYLIEIEKDNKRAMKKIILK
ncbi:exported hypothetical protein [Flavobacterium sp. 9AF]|uniref:T9SS type A sorting domain-containing protein n=1 Tax=Flavobacterium sp. 9AF TaxID=2653142 RepID=UPI0012F3E4F2|nr:T9SS type A sorting domain-containing protein [Flavobacterium sp. 9AF]VXC39862.1 exported hypothetical protein [Flavobacterium sp. 9AF]